MTPSRQNLHDMSFIKAGMAQLLYGNHTFPGQPSSSTSNESGGVVIPV